MNLKHTAEGHGNPRTHRIIYLVLAVAFVALGVIAALAYHRSQLDQQAIDKAKELQARFTAAGLPLLPDQSDIARMFRTDGGAVCADPDNALQQARWNQSLANGASGPGQRPVIADADIARADTLIIDTYCPDKLTDFLNKVHSLKLDDTVDR